MTLGGRGSKNCKIGVMSFMDGPQVLYSRFIDNVTRNLCKLIGIGFSLSFTFAFQFANDLYELEGGLRE